MLGQNKQAKAGGKGVAKTRANSKATKGCLFLNFMKIILFDFFPFNIHTSLTTNTLPGQPSLEDFLAKRDYTGALTLLEFKLKCQDGETRDLLLWIGYCSFHLGNFKRAEDAYR